MKGKGSASAARTLRAACTLCVSFVAFAGAGCHSAFVQATVTNQSGGVIHLFEVAYPSASFGAGELAPGQAFSYRFKILGNGRTRLTWTDAPQHEHKSEGPDLHEGEEGDLRIVFQPNGKVTWDPELRTR